ncbi:MAG: hypothetical protein A2Y07_06945 [Planctomycetes bacterium GWF2_50_10]|nr:MAG: hypothetical protein A2Y07_06945 [Planctomycetes bacterium GWF2_50_10]
MSLQQTFRFSLFVALLNIGISSRSLASDPNQLNIAQMPIDAYISAGDNWYLANSLAVDSSDSLNDSFEMLKNVYNCKRIFWRGLEAAAWENAAHVRPENFRYATVHKWFSHLLIDEHIEKTVCDTAHKKGMEIWGVASLGDWGSPADTPGFNDFPFNFESTLRLQHPEWVPVDKHGYRRQGGTIELAYPEARKAIIDLLVRLSREAGYDGVTFLTYVESFSMRFQDEFGYNEPIVNEFKKRYGIDIRTQPFTRFASKEDWYRLRGEYVTQFLRELKQAISPIKLGMIINPRAPHSPDVWATLPQNIFTYGNVYFDIETWVQDGIVDELSVYGNSARSTQIKTIRDCLWLTRGTKTKVSYITSSPADPLWTQFRQAGIAPIYTGGDDQLFFTANPIPHQDRSILKTGTKYQKMYFLANMIEGKSTAPVSDIIPLAKDNDVQMRRLALLALGKSHDPNAIETIEAALFDPENGVRGMAVGALRYNGRPESVVKVFQAIEQYGNHPICEMAVISLPFIKPFPHDLITDLAVNSQNAMVRNLAIRVLGRSIVKESDVPMLQQALNDTDSYVRYSAAMTLGLLNKPSAIKALIEATRHDDVAVSNRAAVSLGFLAKRATEQTKSLRPQMLQACKELFSKMGNNCNRSDIEWGYRAAGNALLDFGTEGEIVLQDFMDQKQDKRLAELAWRVLYFREKAGENAFNIITEKEDDEAFSKKPK